MNRKETSNLSWQTPDLWAITQIIIIVRNVRLTHCMPTCPLIRFSLLSKIFEEFSLIKLPIELHYGI